jgi:hypothetical protein
MRNVLHLLRVLSIVKHEVNLIKSLNVSRPRGQEEFRRELTNYYLKMREVCLLIGVKSFLLLNNRHKNPPLNPKKKDLYIKIRGFFFFFFNNLWPCFNLFELWGHSLCFWYHQKSLCFWYRWKAFMRNCVV